MPAYLTYCVLLVGVESASTIEALHELVKLCEKYRLGLDEGGVQVEFEPR